MNNYRRNTVILIISAGMLFAGSALAEPPVKSRTEKAAKPEVRLKDQRAKRPVRVKRATTTRPDRRLPKTGRKHAKTPRTRKAEAENRAKYAQERARRARIIAERRRHAAAMAKFNKMGRRATAAKDREAMRRIQAMIVAERARNIRVLKQLAAK